MNNPASPTVTLALEGLAVPTCLTAAPPYVDFGPIRYDCSVVPRRTLVSNQCNYPITVTSAQIGEGTSDQYAVVSGPSYPRALAPGEGFELEVTYARDLLGQHYSPLYVQAAGEPAAAA